MRTFYSSFAGAFILLFSVTYQVFAQAPVYNVKSYGAKGNGKIIDTKAIDKAIETASAAGGGTVYFPARDYLSVTIHLKSNVALYIDREQPLLQPLPAEVCNMTCLKKAITTFTRILGTAIFTTA